MTDDAGAIHRHEPPPILLPWLVRERELAARAVRRAQMRASWDQSMSMIMGVLLGATIPVARMTGLPDSLLFAGIFVLGGGMAWIMWWSAHRRMESQWDSLGRQWTDAGLTRGRCPICLYSLAGAEADERGLAQCAECGAAWQRQRIGEAQEPERARWQRAIGAMLGWDMGRRLIDDLGRQFSAQRLRALEAGADPASRQAIRSVRTVGAPLRIGLAALVGAFYMLPLALLTQIIGRAPLRSAAILLMMAILGASAALFAALIWCSEFGLSANARRRLMLTHGLCPVCAGRDLAPHDLHPDHHRCAACSATWRSS